MFVMKTKLLAVILLILHYHIGQAQSFAINADGSTANSSALLDVKSTTKGILIPRLSTPQRAAIASPAKGLLVYDSTAKNFYFFDGSNWKMMMDDSSSLWRKSGNHIYNNNNGKVGIGIAAPAARLHVADSSVLFSAFGDVPVTPGNPPVSGAGRRMMWYADKAAFRSGYAFGTEWDKDSIGDYSFAAGYACKSKGFASIALGSNSWAIGNQSTAIGNSATANGNNSIAMGDNAIASGDYTLAMGEFAWATGNFSTAIGALTFASGLYSTAMGSFTSASGINSTAMGNSTVSKSFGGTVVGILNDSTNAASAISINPLNRVFQIGNGIDGFTRRNAMTVLQNGNVGIGILNPTQMLEVAGNVTVQNGKGIIRNINGTQLKKLSTPITVNVTLTAGQSQAFAIIWPQTFGAGNIEAYVGNITSGAGGWAEVIMTVSNVTSTGAILYVNNPRSTSWSPDFNVNVIAIGPQ